MALSEPDLENKVEAKHMDPPEAQLVEVQLKNAGVPPDIVELVADVVQAVQEDPGNVEGAKNDLAAPLGELIKTDPQSAAAVVAALNTQGESISIGLMTRNSSSQTSDKTKIKLPEDQETRDCLNKSRDFYHDMERFRVEILGDTLKLNSTNYAEVDAALLKHIEKCDVFKKYTATAMQNLTYQIGRNDEKYTSNKLAYAEIIPVVTIPTEGDKLTGVVKQINENFTLLKPLLRGSARIALNDRVFAPLSKMFEERRIRSNMDRELKENRITEKSFFDRSQKRLRRDLKQEAKNKLSKTRAQGSDDVYYATGEYVNKINDFQTFVDSHNKIESLQEIDKLVRKETSKERRDRLFSALDKIYRTKHPKALSKLTTGATNLFKSLGRSAESAGESARTLKMPTFNTGTNYLQRAKEAYAASKRPTLKGVYNFFTRSNGTSAAEGGTRRRKRRRTRRR